MKRLLLSVSAVCLLSLSATSHAGSCDIGYTRTACPGQEATSFKKCDGKASCTKTVEVDTAEACAKKAVAACANDRLEITKSKVITAKFNGKALPNKSGAADHCLDYSERASEFNQCGK